MRLRIFNTFLIFAVLAVGAVCAQAQDQTTPQDPNEEETRGAFLSSRPPASTAAGGLSASGGSSPSTSNLSASTGKSTTGKSTSSGKTGTGSSSTGRKTTKSTGKTTGKSTAKSTGGGSTTSASVKSYAARPIGLGYSIYMRDISGSPVRTDPTRSFRAGDSIRIALETNTDGYLYVFHTENDGPPEMIFPDARLSGGKNWVDAHVPREIPSSQELNPAYRWFTFDNKPAIERLYIVVSREPLTAIPTGAELVRLCGQNPNACPLKMSAADWAQVKNVMNSKVVVSRMTTYGQAESSTERESVSRGLGLPQNAPAPTVVRMSAVSTDKALVTAIDLIHN